MGNNYSTIVTKYDMLDIDISDKNIDRDKMLSTNQVENLKNAQIAHNKKKNIKKTINKVLPDELTLPELRKITNNIQINNFLRSINGETLKISTYKKKNWRAAPSPNIKRRMNLTEKNSNDQITKMKLTAVNSLKNLNYLVNKQPNTDNVSTSNNKLDKTFLKSYSDSSQSCEGVNNTENEFIDKFNKITSKTNIQPCNTNLIFTDTENLKEWETQESDIISKMFNQEISDTTSCESSINENMHFPNFTILSNICSRIKGKTMIGISNDLDCEINSQNINLLDNVTFNEKNYNLPHVNKHKYAQHVRKAYQNVDGLDKTLTNDQFTSIITSYAHDKSSVGVQVGTPLYIYLKYFESYIENIAKCSCSRYMEFKQKFSQDIDSQDKIKNINRHYDLKQNSSVDSLNQSSIQSFHSSEYNQNFEKMTNMNPTTTQSQSLPYLMY
ncbi:hypothetical protein A3Q56_02443 [Intoshia linei]|uniref:Uncharacterized protein n=1 Tax=Intoshia linei TaxID=1819745 RepID=A0A177B691_9BILA|nr:hypothetical protein A3Q56_02443 [Intoshia linei]